MTTATTIAARSTATAGTAASVTGRLTASGAVAAAGDTLLGGSGATVASVDVVVELYNNNHGDRDRGGGMVEYGRV